MKYPLPLLKQLAFHVLAFILILSLTVLYSSHSFFLFSGILLGIFILFKGLILWSYTHFKLYRVIEVTCTEIQKNILQRSKTILFHNHLEEPFSFVVPFKSSFKPKLSYRIYYTYSIKNDQTIPNRILACEKLTSI